MSLSELFSQRYMARVGCGELFADDLHLHDRRVLRESSDALHLSEQDALKAHVDAELALRVQLAKTVSNANAKRKVKDLPRRARQIMGDAYLQSNRADLAAAVEEASFDNLFQSEGLVTTREPIGGDKWNVASNLLVFDFIEAFFDLLPSEEQLEFSRDLNQRLQRGSSRWYFQLGRWRREDWPRERDSQFDHILYSLKRQADLALQAHHNRAMEAEGEPVEQVDAEAASKALMSAARSLWEADRLLASDLLSGKVRHNAAVRAARQALDQCLTHFRGMVRGPFVMAKPSKSAARKGVFGMGKAAKSPTKQALQGVGEPIAAALRMKQLGHWLAYGGQGADRSQRESVLERANLAEFMARLILFGLPDNEAGDVEEAEVDEVRRYSKLTAFEVELGQGGRRLNHGDAALQLELTDEAAARLAVDTLARLCQFTTGAASAPGEPGFGKDRDPMLPSLDHPRQKDMAQAALVETLVRSGLIIAMMSALVGLGIVIGLVMGGWSPLG